MKWVMAMSDQIVDEIYPYSLLQEESAPELAPAAAMNPALLRKARPWIIAHLTLEAPNAFNSASVVII